ncbi:MAG TPA: antitoxin MazE5 [Microthrixaceae bacterium]|nr:antitoxin MazE5 [Microthrixaceae bacterium]
MPYLRMARIRISTTVDADLLTDARRLRSDSTDSKLIDAALAALLAAERRATIDAEYAKAYENHPIGEPDDWGDLESFRNAVAST